MKNNLLFLAAFSLILCLFACSKEEVIETTAANATVQTSEDSNFRGQLGQQPPNGTSTLMPYVEDAGQCNMMYHSARDYETVVYAQNPKTYDRRVTVFVWRNSNMSAIPHTYTLSLPGNAYVSNRIPTFQGEPTQYNNVFVEVDRVLMRTSTGQWVVDNSSQSTTATIPVQNCYDEDLPCHLTNSCDDDDDGINDEFGFPIFD